MLQHFVVDAFSDCELNDFNWTRQNQQQLRVDLYQSVMNRINDDAKLDDIDKKIIILSFNFTENFRYMKIKKQNVLILIRTFEKSTFFLIFTCNSHWMKFTRDLSSEIKKENRFDFIVRVFQLKLKKLMKNLIKKHVLREIKIHIYVIEFQKRNLFHVHILIINHSKNDVTATNVDVVVQIIISDKIENFDFYKLMTKHMIHKNCKDKIDVICHDKNDQCTKRFLKQMINVTNLNHVCDFSQYRRFARACVSNTVWNNIWVMSYNIYLLKKYQTHLNVEICTSIKSMTYLYKYVFKDFDHVNVSSILIRKINDERAHRNDNREIVNEIQIYHDVRWVDFCETIWRIFQLLMKEIKFSVARLQIHLKNQQRILFDFIDDVTMFQLQNNEKLRQIILIEYFKMNRRVQDVENVDLSSSYEHLNLSKDFRHYTYSDISKHFVWKTREKTWNLRKKNQMCETHVFHESQIEWNFLFAIVVESCQENYVVRKFTNCRYSNWKRRRWSDWTSVYKDFQERLYTSWIYRQRRWMTRRHEENHWIWYDRDASRIDDDYSVEVRFWQIVEIIKQT